MTAYTVFVIIVNSPNGPKKITLKYFCVRHTFMLADNFHRLVEKEMNEMKDVSDWQDFVKCIKECGNACEMEVSDFKDFVSELSQGKESKQTRPLLADVSVAEFRKGSTSLFYKESHANSEYKEAKFMKKIAQRKIMEKRYRSKAAVK